MDRKKDIFKVALVGFPTGCAIGYAVLGDFHAAAWAGVAAIYGISWVLSLL